MNKLVRLARLRRARGIAVLLIAAWSVPAAAWVRYECTDDTGRIIARTNFAVSSCVEAGGARTKNARGSQAKTQTRAPLASEAGRKTEQINIILSEYRKASQRLTTLQATTPPIGQAAPMAELERTRSDLKSLREELTRLGVRALPEGPAPL